jgi:heme-degrading monooxygenase HmoA
MFTRIVELTTKPGKNRELSDTINDKVLPILKKQKGFVDETVLIADKEANHILAVSFWNTKEDAEQYHRVEYPKVREMLQHFLEFEPLIRTYEVHTSTTHRIAAGKAA